MSVVLESPISAYHRASSYIQEDSHERQHAIISKFLLDNKLAIPTENWFSDFRPRDGAAFAKDIQTLLHRVQRGLVKTVIVSNLDRWGTQDVDEFFEFRNILLKGGCKLWSVEDGDLTSKKMGDIITIIVKAEQMREYVRRSAKNIASGKERLAQAGHWTGGKCSPFEYDELKGRLQGIDARKVQIAEKRLAELDEEHRAAVRFAMRTSLDEQTWLVADEEVNRLVEERKVVLAETKPFLVRYQENVAELVDFHTRLLALIKTVQDADVDARAVKLMEVLQSVTLFFTPSGSGRRRS